MNKAELDLNNIPVDEESEKIIIEINKLKEMGLQNNIDFEKAKEEKNLIESKYNTKPTKERLNTARNVLEK